MSRLNFKIVQQDVDLMRMCVRLESEISSFYAEAIFLDEWELNRSGEVLTQFNQNLNPGILLYLGSANGAWMSSIILEAISTDKWGYTLFRFYGETMPEENQLHVCQAYFKLPMSELDKLCVNFPGKVLNNGIDLVFE